MNILYLGLSKYFIFFNWFKNLCLINLLHIHFDLGNILILFCILIFNKFATSPSEFGGVFSEIVSSGNRDLEK